MPRILFTRDPSRHEIDPTAPRYRAGEVHEVSAASAARWKRRGAAVDAPPEPEAEVEPMVEPEPEPAPVSEPSVANRKRSAKAAATAPAPDGEAGPAA